ncbi:uncharacterized mitochondrial protein AtMg00810-like [Capsicum annuum]|uniref:uncharacterized mitochondrial protein AtMg00810-like n=1 Tax=Capsicum annuum TaxID=4072 RepID=UPI001FB090F7|nr:uncharacterized mitochondrial protein AtMg00810-like [Capsicum annuum]
MKNFGNLKFFLGIEFVRMKEGYVMSQHKYALELVSELGLSGTKPVYTLLDPNLRLTSIEYDAHIEGSNSASDDKPLKDVGKYQRVVEYIKSASGLGLFMPSQETDVLTTFYDSDWETCLQTRRSVTSYMVKFENVIVSWKSKKQEIVAWTSAKAEFRSMASIVAEITWLIGVYKELGVDVQQPIKLFCDSKAAIKLQQTQFFIKEQNTLLLIATC